MRAERSTKVRVAVFLSVLALVAVACGSGDDDDGEGSGTTSNGDVEVRDSLTIALSAEIANIDPQSSINQVNTAVNFNNVAEPLVTLDGQSAEIQPALAESWEAVDDTTYQFTLREGVEFHNGEPFNAEAAVASIERILDPATESTFVDYYKSIDEAEAIDEHTLEIRTNGPAPALLRLLSFLMMVPPEAAASDPGSFATHPIGTGPFVFESLDTDRIVLTRNEDYWGEPANMKEVVFLTRPEASTRVAAVQAGEVDIAYDIPVEQAESVPEVRSSLTLEVVHLRFNTAKDVPTGDQRVRRAIILATNRTELRESLLGADFSEPVNCQMAPPGVLGFNPDLEEQPYDPEEAKALVEEAGAVGKTIRIVNARGRFPKAEEFLEQMKTDIEKTGLKVDAQSIEFQSWRDIVFAEGPNQVEAVVIGQDSSTFDVFQPFSAVVLPTAPTARFPHDEYPEVAGLLEQATVETDEAQREELLQTASEQICEADAFDGLFYYHQIWGTQEGISWDLRKDNRISLGSVTFEG